MGHEDLIIIGRVTGALVIGALIGFERTFHGRPAGFRTHSLVCIASAVPLRLRAGLSRIGGQLCHTSMRSLRIWLK